MRLSYCFAIVCIVVGFALPVSANEPKSGVSEAPAISVPATIPVIRDKVSDASEHSGNGKWGLLAVSILALLAYATRQIWLPSIKLPILKQWMVTTNSKRPLVGGMKMLDSKRLTPKHSLHTLEWNGELFFLACSDEGIKILARTNSQGLEDLETKSPADSKKAFSRARTK